MKVFLVDGTYELFRQFFGRPGHVAPELGEVDAVRGVLISTLGLLEDGATHVGVSTDHVIESFRNQLWPGYKTGAGIDPILFAQFPLLESAVDALGVKVWANVELEADDALASAAAVAHDDSRVEQVCILTPDKDLAQCVRGARVVQYDRRNNKVFDHEGVIAKFGVEPLSIPDYLALVGDSADGFPGLAKWGAKSAAAVLAHYKTIDAIPDDVSAWEVSVRGAPGLAATLATQRDLAELFKVLATLRVDRDLLTDVDELAWRGPRPEFEDVCARLEMPSLWERANRIAGERGF